MKKFINLMALAAMLFVPWQATAQNTLTTCQGTATNDYVPLYGYYADETQNGQMIYPADSLTAMLNMQITEMVFYISGTGYGSGTSAIGNWIVSLGTTTETTLSGINSTVSLTEVYSGALTFNSGNTLMTVTFTDGFTYTGGNLLVQFNHPVSAGYQAITFSGVSATGASYCYNSQRDFLPKVTFGYSNPPSCVRPSDLVASNVTSDGLTLSWTDTLNSGATYSIDYWKNGSDTTTVTSSSTSYTFTGLDANTLYNFAVKAVCSATDESSVLRSSFRTACGGSTCDLTLQLGSSSSWSNPWNSGATVQLWQDSVLFGSYTSSTTVEVCGTSPIVVKYTGASYSYYDSYATITVLDGGGVTAYSGSSGDVLCTITTPCPSCIPPAALVATPDSESIVLSWTPRSGASQFIVYLNDSIVDNNVSDTFYTFTGLTANTAYTIGVQSVCTSDDSSAIATVSTRTTCGQMPIPYTEDFEDIPYNGAWPSCWNLILSHNTDPSVNYNDNHTANGEYSMYMMANGDYNMFASSAVPLAGNNIYVRFWSHLVYGSWIKAGVMTNLNDTSTFIPLVTVSGTNWTEYEFNTANLDPDSTYYVAWIGTGNSNWSALGMVDDIYISEIPSCIRVTNVALEAADQTSLTLSWGSNGNNGASYTVSYWANGSTDTLTATASDTTVVLNALDANTVYNVIVVANCSGGDAEASPVFTFRTACGDIALPFFDDFDSYDNGYWPPCWHRLRAYGTDPSVNAQFHHSGSQSMFLLTANDTTLFCTPSTIPTTGNNIYVRYQAYLSWSSSYTETKWIKAGVMTDTADMSTFIALDSVEYHNFNNVFEEREFNTSTLDPTATYWVAWMYYSTNNGYSSNRGAIDDVYISEIPSCMRVSNITAIAIDSASITLSWVDTLNSGATYTITNLTDNEVYDNISGTTYTVDNLTPNTLYNFTVAVNCGSENAEAVSYSARTACGAEAIPYTEGFENHSTGAEPTCWTGRNGQAYVRNGSAHGGSNRLDFRGSNSTIAVMPQFAQEVNTLQMTFWTRPEGNYAACGSLSVGYMTNPAEDTTFVELANYSYTEFIDGSAQYGERTVMFNAAPNGAYMAFRHNASSSNYYWYVDDITVDVLPDCVPVSLLTVDTVTATEATISWVAAEGQSAWYVKVDSMVYNPSDTTYTITGLEARTQYTAYVAANCSGDTSTWQSIEFTTDCANGSCDITVTSTSDYSYSYYCPTVHVWQNGVEAASVNAATQTVNVCSGLPVSFVYEEPYYNWGDEPTVTIINGGEEVLFDGSTDNYSDGDTLASVANACPSCLLPTGVRATAIDSNSISFAWTELDDVDGYLISFNGDDYQAASSGTIDYSSLTANTAYTFSVKAICVAATGGLGDTSAARTITVRTTCGQMAIPYTESFEGQTTGTIPTCWNLISGTPEVYGSNAHTGSNALAMGSGSDMIASSLVPLAGDSIHVTFWANLQGGTLEAGVMTNLLDDSTFTPMVTSTGTNGYELMEFNTMNLAHDSSYYVAFRYVAPYNYVYIDDINIRLDEGCMYPSNLTTVPTSNSVDLTWTNTGAATDFAVEYRLVNGSWSTPDIVSTTTASITGLNASATYEVRVGTICGTDTMWSTISFQTACGLVAVPYYEEFDSPTGTLPPCWNYTNASYFHWNRWTTHAETSGNGEMMAGNGSAGEFAILPELNAPFTKLQISFLAKLGNVSEGDSMVMGAYDATTNQVYEAGRLAIPGQSRENFVLFTFDYTNYTGLGNRIAIGHSHNDVSDWGFALDSIVIIELPSCYPPSDVAANNTMYPNTADDVFFTWTPNGPAAQWQVYIDTITSTTPIDSVADSLLVTVDTNYYHVPFNSLAYGARYRFFVRSICGFENSNWVELQNGFSTDEVWMNNTGNYDTVVGCDFIVFDNGGPVAGYLHNSNSKLILISGDAGRELQLQGGYFSHGADANTLTVYDGIGDTGTVLYQRTQTNMTETIDSILATSTTGAMTITFSSGYYAALGYELYIHCVGVAECARPTRLHAEMTSDSQADVTWEGDAPNYNFYYRISGSNTWVRIPTTNNNVTLTGLQADTVYDMYVVALCSATDSSTASVEHHLTSTYVIPVAPCHTPTNVMASDITTTSALISWTVGGTETAWVLDYNGTTVDVNTNPYLLAGLTPNTPYTVKVKAVCDTNSSSSWSTPTTFTTLDSTPAVTYYTVTVVSNDTTMGTVSGGGTYEENTHATLVATAAEGYHLVSWSNGETAATISITVTSDTTLTATFAENEPNVNYYTLTLTTNNPAWGTVTGAGTYEEGTNVEIKAISNNGYHFLNWSDGVADSVRTIIMNADISLSATFAKNVGIDDVNAAAIALFPNPASSTVTITGIEGTASVSIVDINGREVEKQQALSGNITLDVSNLAQGAYFVRIVGEQVNAIRKLIVK